MITHVALKGESGTVWSLPKPNRHGHVIHEICKEFGKENGSKIAARSIQGFLNDKGEFLGRVEAWFEAKSCNQILPPYHPANASKRSGKVEDVPQYDNPNGRELFSEDVW